MSNLGGGKNKPVSSYFEQCWNDFCKLNTPVTWLLGVVLLLSLFIVILIGLMYTPEGFSIESFKFTSKFPFISKEPFTAYPYSIGAKAGAFGKTEPYQYTKNDAGELTQCPGGANTVESFAYVPTDTPAEQPLSASQYQSWNAAQTAKRLDVIDKNLMPKTSENVTPYNIDVADPIAYSFLVNAPRVVKKDRLALQADPFRGDIPINIYPDVPLIQKSQYDRSSLRLDGAFSEPINKNYAKLTGKAYFNMPQMMSQGGVNM